MRPSLIRMTLTCLLLAGALRAADLKVTKAMSPPVAAEGDTVTVCLTLESQSATPKADIAWVIDTTGSMGTTIDNIKTNIAAFTTQLASLGIDYRQALTDYGDPVTEPMEKIITRGFAPDDATFITWLYSLAPGSGGDWAEAGLEALTQTAAIAWRPDASHTLVLVTDAPVHNQESSGAWPLALSATVTSLKNAGMVIHTICPTSLSVSVWADSPNRIAYLGGGKQYEIYSGDYSGLLSDLGTAVGSYTNVLIRDPLPPELLPIPGTYPGGVYSGGELRWTLSTLGRGAPYQVCFNSVVTSAYAGFISNTALVSADGVTETSSNLEYIFYPSPTLTPSISPTFTPSPTVSPTFTISPTLTVSPTLSATPTNSQTTTPSATPSITPTMTATPWPLILHPNPPSPNPFGQDGVWLGYWLSTEAKVDIRIWDVSGEEVRKLDPFDGKMGNNETFWDGRNSAGQPVASGIYICQIKARTRRDEEQAVFVKCAAVR